MVVRCRRCNKVLTVPESVERGYGPVCWRIIQGKGNRQQGIGEFKEAEG
ncbi:hypothetical protein ES702_03846 [subsurface metagenome]